MDSYNFQKMKDLKNRLNSDDIIYLGVLQLDKKDPVIDSNMTIAYDIYLSIEPNNSNESNKTYKFYNNNGQLLAISLNDGKSILPTESFLDTFTPGNLEQLKNLIHSQENSFNKINLNLEKIAKSLDIPKEEILSITETDELSEESLKNKSDKDEKIHLKDNKDTQTKKDMEYQPKNTSKIDALEKQSTDLNQKVNEYQTLGDILGIPQGGKLVAVYSDSIENGKTNTTRFSFLLKDKDGNYYEIPNIEQAGGIYPNTNVAQSNENGDTVNKQNVNSIYKIKGDGNIEYMLTANIGPYGTIELGIGQRDRTQGIDNSNLVTTPLKTTSTYQTHSDIKELINGERNGSSSPVQRSKEAGSHSNKCPPLNKNDVDGKPNTGHIHAEQLNFNNIASTIMKAPDYSDIQDVYSKEDVENKLTEVFMSNPNLSQEELIEIVGTEMQSSAEVEKAFGHIIGPRS